MAQDDKGQGPIRRCVICGARLPKRDMTRYVCPGGGQEPTPDPTQTMPGRGFYCCPAPTCIRQLGKYKGWRKKCQGEKRGRKQASG